MTDHTEERPFFVGYMNKVPSPLMIFSLAAAFGILIGMGALSFAIGSATTDPGDGRFIGGRANFKSLVGVVEEFPYPVLRVAPTEENPTPRAYILTAPGKAGLQDKAAQLQGQMATAGGFILTRGDLDMLQASARAVKPVEEDLTPSQVAYEPAAAIPLGRWRMVGEISDGKCYAGAMRPGIGLSHRACANLCLIGGTPPIFVTNSEIEGTSYFLLADQDGGPLPNAFFDLVSILVELDGEVERRDDILIFKVDISQAKVI
jgi:hypothetical protein